MQGRFSFYMTSSGEEATAVGSAAALSMDDVIFTQYREQGVLMWRGFTPEDMADQACWGPREKGPLVGARVGTGRAVPGRILHVARRASLQAPRPCTNGTRCHPSPRSATATPATRARAGRCPCTTAARRSTSTRFLRRWRRSCRMLSGRRMRSRHAGRRREGGLAGRGVAVPCPGAGPGMLACEGRGQLARLGWIGTGPGAAQAVCRRCMPCPAGRSSSAFGPRARARRPGGESE